MADMEYTTLPKVMKKLDSRFKKVAEKKSK
jgi:fructose 1,6-bisphosphatase